MQWLVGPMGWCVFSALLFGASTPLCKPLLSHFGPVGLAALLYLGTGLITLPFALRTRERTPKSGDKLRVLGAVVFGGILGPVLLLYGLRVGDAGDASLLLNLESVATALLGWVIFREHISIKGWVAAALVFVAGVVLALPVEATSFTSALWIGAACLCWGFDNHFTADVVEFSPAQTTCIKGLCAGGFNCVLAFVILDEPLVGGWTMGSALLIGALCYGGSMVLYVAGAQQLGATHSQIIFSSAPYWGLVIAWIALGEAVALGQIFAALLMITAVWMLSREDHEHTHRHEAESHTHWHRHDPEHHIHSHRSGMWSVFGWHFHHHHHDAVEHTHSHRSDIHHRHH